MLYTVHYSDMGRLKTFNIMVEDSTMTWTTDPPGGEPEPGFSSYFTRGGAPGSGKRFEILPDGKAREIT